MVEFLKELRRRRIYRVGAAYVVFAWGVTQVVDVLSQVFALPAWIGQPTLTALALGLPLTLLGAWIIEGRLREGADGRTRTPRTVLDGTLFGGAALVTLFVGYQVITPMIGPDAPTAQPLLAADNSIAVLPFANLSPDPDNAFFADGMHDDLLTRLAKIASLKVISKTSVLGYRDTTLNMREIGEQLGVAHILEGAVRRAGDALRINVQLIRTDTDEHLWAETYDRELSPGNVFSIQSDMAVAIADALEATLLPQEIERLSDVPTENTEAYDYYLSGNEFFDSGDYVTDVPLAVEAYQNAVDADPEFALAHAALSRAHAMMYWFFLDRSEARIGAAREAVERAFALDPDLPEAHLAMGEFHYRTARDYARALSEYAIAAEGLPGDSSVPEQIGYIQRRLGDWEQATTLLARASELDPRNVTLLIEQGNTQLALRDYAAADEFFARAIAIDPENINAYEWRSFVPLYRDGDVAAHRAILAVAPGERSGAQYFLGWLAALYERDFAGATAVLDGWELGNADPITLAEKDSLYGVTLMLSGDPAEGRARFGLAEATLRPLAAQAADEPGVHIALGEALAGLGESEAAIAEGRRAMELLPSSVDALVGPQYQLDAIVRVFVPAGAHDLAIRELEAYLSTRGASWSLKGLLPDPRFDAIRDMPEFAALEQRYAAN